jgi:hypothetical protein
LAWSGLAWSGLAWSGLAWGGLAWSGEADLVRVVGGSRAQPPGQVIVPVDQREPAEQVPGLLGEIAHHDSL